MHADTSEWAEQIQFQFFRNAEPARKLAMAAELTSGMLLLAETGIRQRHPQATASEVRRLLSDLILGPELAERVYGPISMTSGDESK
jgi:hypothetical protein